MEDCEFDTDCFTRTGGCTKEYVIVCVVQGVENLGKYYVEINLG